MSDELSGRTYRAPDALRARAEKRKELVERVRRGELTVDEANAELKAFTHGLFDMVRAEDELRAKPEISPP